jgi:hypothetical protein
MRRDNEEGQGGMFYVDLRQGGKTDVSSGTPQLQGDELFRLRVRQIRYLELMKVEPIFRVKKKADSIPRARKVTSRIYVSSGFCQEPWPGNFGCLNRTASSIFDAMRFGKTSVECFIRDTWTTNDTVSERRSSAQRAHNVSVRN